jgi:hypothetical protein
MKIIGLRTPLPKPVLSFSNSNNPHVARTCIQASTAVLEERAITDTNALTKLSLYRTDFSQGELRETCQIYLQEETKINKQS